MNGIVRTKSPARTEYPDTHTHQFQAEQQRISSHLKLHRYASSSLKHPRLHAYYCLYLFTQHLLFSNLPVYLTCHPAPLSLLPPSPLLTYPPGSLTFANSTWLLTWWPDCVTWVLVFELSTFFFSS